jgi:hypothetical protein
MVRNRSEVFFPAAAAVHIEPLLECRSWSKFKVSFSLSTSCNRDGDAN